MSAVERHVRKQVLLTRIAFERVELARDAVQLRAAAQWPQLLRAGLGAALGAPLAAALFGGDGGSERGAAKWLPLALALLRRYRVAATVVGALLPLLGGQRGGRGWRRVLRVAGLGAALWFGWRGVTRSAQRAAATARAAR